VNVSGTNTRRPVLIGLALLLALIGVALGGNAYVHSDDAPGAAQDLGRRLLRSQLSSAGGATRLSFTDTLHLEENHSYLAKARMAGDDHWYWAAVQAPGPRQTQTFTFTLPPLATEAYAATLRADMHGLIANPVDPDHHTRIYLNGHLVEDALWDGYVSRLSTIAMPSSYLLEGTNAISITAPADTGVGYDALAVNWFEIDYGRAYVAQDDVLAFSTDEAGTWQYRVRGFTSGDVAVYDVTDPFNVGRIISGTVEPRAGYTLRFQDAITETTAHVAVAASARLSPSDITGANPADLLTTTNGADYVVITHGDFISEVLPLADHRAAQDLRTMVVDVQDVYDVFGDGVFTPQAIHDFLDYAFHEWTPPAPRYVLLVGNGNFDYRCYWRCEPNYIPPYMIYPNANVGEVAADNRFVTVSGDDALPDMALGRLPVTSAAEAAAVVDKILAYEQNPPGGGWNERALFVADNQPDKEENAGDFWDLADEIAGAHLPAGYAAEKIYYDKYADEAVPGHPDPPRPEPPYYAGVGNAHASIVAAINEGQLLVTYIGHGAPKLWADEPLFEEEDVASLSNGDRLPVFLSLSCSTANFSVPGGAGQEQDCVDGSLLRAAGGGAVASWGCTAQGNPSAHRHLARGFFTAVFTDGVREVGWAAVEGKLELHDSTAGSHHLVDTYTLFGDPATKLHLPSDAAPADQRPQRPVGSSSGIHAKHDGSDSARGLAHGQRDRNPKDPGQVGPRYKVRVDRNGIYQLTYGDLQAAGLPVASLDPRTFQLFNAGSEMRIHVPGEADGSFDPGDLILFYGEGLDTKYTDTNAYWLAYGEVNGLRMRARDGTPPEGHAVYLPLVTRQR
jgi:hypothetical protein